MGKEAVSVCRGKLFVPKLALNVPGLALACEPTLLSFVSLPLGLINGVPTDSASSIIADCDETPCT
jgi:hypothetical protein